jgi:hypothetical protein
VNKKYQVFVSSTYADLEEERRTVIQTVIGMDCIPAGMELFPATDEEQFEFIKRVIDDCDYYLLIIGGRYGSTTATGISYTEQEYDYAIERGLKVIALVHGAPDNIPFGKSEKDPALRERLQKFRDNVAGSRLVKFWTSAEDLPGLVALSLSRTITTFPAVGWIRADRAASEDILGEVNELRKENAELRASVATMTAATAPPRVEDIAGLDEEFVLSGTCSQTGFSKSFGWSARLPWRDVFASIAPYLHDYASDTDVKGVLARAAFDQSSQAGSFPHLDDQVFKTVAVQLRTLGLAKIERLGTTNGGTAMFWSLTPRGEQLMLETRVVRTKTGEDPAS